MRKKILIFIDWFYPGYKAGGPISSNVNLVEHLGPDFKFFIITTNTDYCESIPYENIVPDSWTKLMNSEIYYFSKARLSFKNIIKATKEIEFDAVYINGIYSLYFSLFPLIYFKYFTKKRIIVSARGMFSDQTFSSKKTKKKLFYLLARLTGLYNNITIHATNNNEMNSIRKTIKFKGEIKVAPNLPPKSTTEYSKIGKVAGKLNLISIARISEEKNTLFALQVLNKCTAGIISLDLYGSVYNEEYWNECRKIIKSLPSNIIVTFKGPIEKKEIQGALKNNHFLIMPSVGENYGHSIVESFISGRPVIISDRTPWHFAPPPSPPLRGGEKGEGPVGWDLPLDKPEEFVRVIEYCAAMEQEEYDRMSRNAFEYAQGIINDPATIEANRKLFD